MTIGTIRREPELPALDAGDLDWLIEQYLIDRRSKLPADTVDGYAYKLRWFRDWWEMTGPGQDWILGPHDLIRFEAYLREVKSKRTGQTLAYHTRNDVLRRLREALHWSWPAYTDHDYASWVPKCEGGPPQRQAAKPDKLQRLLDAATESPYPARDRTILACFIGMGLRRGEVHSLNAQDIVVEADLSGYVEVKGKKTKANPTGRRMAAFDAATGRYLGGYLDVTGFTSGPLFRTWMGSRLSKMGIYRTVKRAVDLAGLNDEIQACHDLRRAFATHWLRMRHGDGWADLLRRQLGHASYSMTSQYLLPDVEDLRFDHISPLTWRPRPDDLESGDVTARKRQ